MVPYILPYVPTYPLTTYIQRVLFTVTVASGCVLSKSSAFDYCAAEHVDPRPPEKGKPTATRRS